MGYSQKLHRCNTLGVPTIRTTVFWIGCLNFGKLPNDQASMSICSTSGGLPSHPLAQNTGPSTAESHTGTQEAQVDCLPKWGVPEFYGSFLKFLPQTNMNQNQVEGCN